MCASQFKKLEVHDQGLGRFDLQGGLAHFMTCHELQSCSALTGYKSKTTSFKNADSIMRFLLSFIMDLSLITFQSPTSECYTIGGYGYEFGGEGDRAMMNFILACSHVLQPVHMCSFLSRLESQNSRDIAFPFSVPKTVPDTFPLFSFLHSLKSRAKCHFFKLQD